MIIWNEEIQMNTYEVWLRTSKTVEIEAPDAATAAGMVQKQYKEWTIDDVWNQDDDIKDGGTLIGFCEECKKAIFHSDEYVVEPEDGIYGCGPCAESWAWEEEVEPNGNEV
jgi:hypothetical protein